MHNAWLRFVGNLHLTDSVDALHSLTHFGKCLTFNQLFYCSAFGLNAHVLISILLPILLLLSVLQKRNWVSFRNFADSVLAQLLAKRTWVDLRNFANPVIAHLLAKTNLGRFQKFCRFCSCSATCLNALWLRSAYLTDCVEAQRTAPFIVIICIKWIIVLLHCNYIK